MSLWDRLKARFVRREAGGRRGAGEGSLVDEPDEPDEADAVEETDERGVDRRGQVRAEGSADPSDRREGARLMEEARDGEHVAIAIGQGRDDLAQLARVGLGGGPSVEEAIAILRRARGTLREADAVARVYRVLGERALPEPVRVACADILAARGDEQGALKLLEGAASAAGLLLAADLFASSGQLPRALGTIERVLGRDIDAPGARERHQRWRAALGLTVPKVGHLDEATIVAASPVSGPFRLLREVARGGAGVVYEAEDEVLGRRVAFKVYHARASAEALLEREARTAAALAGPGVVRVLDAAPAEGWIALEWIARGSVRDVLRGGDAGALAPIDHWAGSLARALARVHSAGIVHADVKPANVLLRQLSEPVLGDFGIARPRGAPGEGGSPGYMSPERLSGAPSDPRDDIYGFGRVLEDVLHLLVTRSPSELLENEEAWRTLASMCLGPAEARPADGAELVQRLPHP